MQTHTKISDEIRSIVGDVDDLVVERIAATGASPTEVAEAHRYFVAGENDEDLVERVSSPRVIEVRAILADVLDDGDEPGEPAAGKGEPRGDGGTTDIN